MLISTQTEAKPAGGRDAVARDEKIRTRPASAWSSVFARSGVESIAMSIGVTDHVPKGTEYMASKTVRFNSKGIEKLPNDKPVVYRIQTEGGKNNYTGVAQRGRVQERIKEHLAEDRIPWSQGSS